MLCGESLNTADELKIFNIPSSFRFDFRFDWLSFKEASFSFLYLFTKNISDKASIYPWIPQLYAFWRKYGQI